MAPAFRHAYQGDEIDAGKIEVAGRILVERPKAVLFDDTGGGGPGVWLPKSKIRIEPNKDGTVAVFMPEWLAKKEGLI